MPQANAPHESVVATWPHSLRYRQAPAGQRHRMPRSAPREAAPPRTSRPHRPIGYSRGYSKGPSRRRQPADRRSAQHAAIRLEYLCIAVLPGERSLMPLSARSAVAADRTAAALRNDEFDRVAASDYQGRWRRRAALATDLDAMEGFDASRPSRPVNLGLRAGMFHTRGTERPRGTRAAHECFARMSRRQRAGGVP